MMLLNSMANNPELLPEIQSIIVHFKSQQKMDVTYIINVLKASEEAMQCGNNTQMSPETALYSGSSMTKKIPIPGRKLTTNMPKLPAESNIMQCENCLMWFHKKGTCHRKGGEPIRVIRTQCKTEKNKEISIVAN